jgi:UDP-glucose 4-epimerase
MSVVGVDDLSRGALANLELALPHPKFTFEKMDCTRRRELRTAFDGCDAIVHLAAQKIPRYGGTLMTLEANVAGVNAAAHAALSLDADLLVASTSDVYGNAVPPFAEDDNVVLGPPTTRRWAYAVSKLYDEHVCLALAEERDLKVTLLRLFGSYGPRNHPSWWGGPLSVFLEDLLDGKRMELHGDGRQVRSFTYVSDTVDGFVRAMARPESAGEVINIANEEPIEIVDLAQRVQTAMGIEGELRADIVSYASMGGNYQDVKIRVPSTEKAQRVLGFEAQVKLDEGLQSTIAWHRALRGERVAA